VTLTSQSGTRAAKCLAPTVRRLMREFLDLLHHAVIIARPSHETGADSGLLVAPQDFVQRLAHFQSPIVVDKSLLSESIHEQVDSWARRTDHLRQNLMA